VEAFSSRAQTLEDPIVEKAIVIFSGGLDSTTLIYSVRSEFDVQAVTFDYGSKHNLRERRSAVEIARACDIPHFVLTLPFVNEHFSSDLLQSGGDIPEGHYEDRSMRRTVVPFRNGIMLSIAVGFAESHDASTVMYAAHAGDHAIYPDCRPEFFEAFAESARLGTYAGVRIVDPFIRLSKKEVVLRGVDSGVPFHMTYSCYKGGDIHCGVCGACVERKEAFIKAGILDPTQYER
jgi:7-cyano-7-deazaguanine synthase